MSGHLMLDESGVGSREEKSEKDIQSLHLPAIVNNGITGDAFKPISPTDKNISMSLDKKQILPPVRPQRGIKIKSSTSKNKESIKDYFDNNRQNMEKYIMEFVSVEELQQWIKKKTSNISYSTEHSKDERTKEQCVAWIWQTASSLPCIVSSSLPVSSQTMPSRHDWALSRVLRGFRATLKLFEDVKTEESAVRKIALAVSSALHAKAYRVFNLSSEKPTSVQYFLMDENQMLFEAEAEDIKIILKVANTAAVLRLSRGSCPIQVPKKMATIDTKLSHVMYQPILNESGQITYVLELWRTDTFNEGDEKLCSSFVIWNSLALHYYNLYSTKKREYDMYGFLLQSVKSIFEDIESLDHVVKNVLEFVQKLVKADRASLFLVDSKKAELVPPLFDIEYGPNERNSTGIIEEIRVPLKTGIAGHVALTGKNLNIADAYSDARFNRDVDELTGYKTKNILCMPIKVQGNILGVVQMINKRNNGTFDKKDEMAFERFSTFFGLALQHVKFYHEILKQKLKYQVTLEVLSYHNTCKDREVEEINKDIDTFNINMDDYYLDPYMFDDFQKCKAAITMFDDLFDLSNFNRLAVIRFILTVKINYRAVPYHNFNHGWSVAHAMYVMLKNDKEKRFNAKMRQALFVASLCHDLDHRGYTNKYLNETASPLATMYSTSPLEHHHFNITVKILHQNGHDIFSHMAHDEYRNILIDIEQCILATDLAVFFPNLKKLQSILHTDDVQPFNWQDSDNCKLAMAISMTAADLSASTKPWDIQIKTVQVIFEEFYEQGDKERAAGKTPIAMMDRHQPEEQVTCQVGFLEQICIPCYEILYKILPNTKPMYEMVGKNLNHWKSIKTEKIPILCPKGTASHDDDAEAFVSDSELNISEKKINKKIISKHQPSNTINKSVLNTALKKIDTMVDLTDEMIFNDKSGKIIKMLQIKNLTDDEDVVTPSHGKNKTKY